MLVLAPLRGVTVRCFRETFAGEIAAAGFEETVTPFISVTPGLDPLKDREIRGADNGCGNLLVTPQFIGKDPAALASALERIKAAGFETADLNCGCPFPMVRNKGRGSGLLRSPQLLAKMLEAGCSVMGEGRFSVKTRLGVEREDELLSIIDVFNAYPLRRMTVHARTARQMYDGEVNMKAFERVCAASRNAVMYNGDAPLPEKGCPADVMVGRAFIRSLGERDDSAALLRRYIAASRLELPGDRPVLGRIKELLEYWKHLPRWRRIWPVAKLSRTTAELESVICSAN